MKKNRNKFLVFFLDINNVSIRKKEEHVPTSVLPELEECVPVQSAVHRGPVLFGFQNKDRPHSSPE